MEHIRVIALSSSSTHVLELVDNIYVRSMRSLFSFVALNRFEYNCHFQNGKVNLFYDFALVSFDCLYDSLYKIDLDHEFVHFINTMVENKMCRIK